MTRALVNPPASSAAVRRVMTSNRATNTGPERAFRTSLLLNGFRGYRLNWSSIAGRPDIAFVRRRIAIFVHGCFWHRCPTCRLPLPKANREFWKRKFRTNRNRDLIKRRALEDLGWRVFELYECWIRENPGRVPREVRAAFRQEASPR